jgi:hypothetical protein
LSQGSFRLSIAALDSAFTHAVARWPYDRSTCSIHGTVSGTAPVVAGSGTGAYRGITGTFSLTVSLDEDYVKGPACDEDTLHSSRSSCRWREPGHSGHDGLSWASAGASGLAPVSSGNASSARLSSRRRDLRTMTMEVAVATVARP